MKNIIKTIVEKAISDPDFEFDMVTFAVVALFAVFGILLIVTWPAATGMIL